MKHLIGPIATAVLLLLVLSGALSAKENAVVRDLEAIIAKGEPASAEQLDTIRKNIEKSPRENLALLLEIANSRNLPEESLAVYILALGFTGEPAAVDDIIRLADGKQNETLQKNTYRALAAIGGDKPAEFLFRRLQTTTDAMTRYLLLDLLSRLRYQPALPATIEILQQDPSCFYDQLVFTFGRYGDMAVPFLLGRINDGNKNVRANAIMLLGQWLIPVEAVLPLKKQFNIEKDPNIRALILSSLEKINPNVDDIRIFSEDVLITEKDSNVIQFAFETIGNFAEMKNHVKSFKAQKKDDPAGFETTFEDLYESKGGKGDYQRLAAASTAADEPRLKKLKEVILERGGKECFFDYQKINDVIMLNRLI